MITVNELRIGNWVYYPPMENNYQILRLDIDNENNYEPIPLTEEILLKCGFERYKTYLFRKRINDDFYLIFSPKDTRPLYCILRMYNDDMDILQECNNSVDCNYLHQLQNLYFALTNEELTVNL